MPTYKAASRAATFRRILAVTAGGALLAILSHLIVVKTGQTGAQAAVTYGIAAALVAASFVLGDMPAAARVIAVACMVAIELGNVLASAEIVMVRRDQAASEHRSRVGANAHALAELVKANDAVKAAQVAVAGSAALPGCKDRCVSLLRETAAAAAQAQARAVALVEANPAPVTSPSPLADHLGLPAWALDLVLAGLYATSNGLAALLLSFGAHTRRPATATGTSIGDSLQTSFPVPPGGGVPLPSPDQFRDYDPAEIDVGEDRVAARARTVASFEAAYRARHGRRPSAGQVARATGIPRATAHRYQRRAAAG